MDMREIGAMPLSLSYRSREEAEDEIVSDDAGGEDHDGEQVEQDGEHAVVSCVPRRPRRTTTRGAAAARQRVQRVVMLLGPGQTLARQASPCSSRRGDAFMTHLPASPPRGVLSRASIFQFTDSRMRVSREKSPMNSPRVKEAERLEDTRYETDDEELEVALLAEQRPEVDESQEDKMEDEEQDEAGESSSGGPHALDIRPSVKSPEIDSFDDDVSTEDDEKEEEEEEEIDEYRQVQAARARFEAEQHERDGLRLELETYVASLSSRCDADGEKLVEFPRNFQQIVSLMTAQDIASESTLKPSTSSAKAGEDHKSWSQILIQNSLAKQQAFGTLDESEDATDGDDSLEAKIALKMARIRQLDGILEEKLGKNLYATTGATTKTKRVVNPQEPEVVVTTAARRSLLSGTKSRSVSTTSRSSTSLQRRAAQSAQGPTNHIERNRKIVENGGKANLTREEEARVKRLLRESTENTGGADSTTAAPPLPTEFRLDQQHQDEIEKLIADKRGLYPSAIIMALDDVPEDENDTLQEPPRKKEHRKANGVQETKRERLARQRLQRIEEELKFLQEHESVPILPDDEDDDASDGCSSERSFMTTTSMLSTASTRSGVTRRQLDQFVAAEVTKSEDTIGEKASHDEIQKLLRSLSLLPMATSRPATTATV